ncbi:hypothetical protein GCM10028791_19930 [Echinicola sediminis]
MIQRFEGWNDYFYVIANGPRCIGGNETIPNSENEIAASYLPVQTDRETCNDGTDKKTVPLREN